MSSSSSIVEKTNTLFDETIFITPKCAVHLHNCRNKVVPLMKPFIFILTMALNLAITSTGQLMTFVTTISYMGSITTTSITKT